MMKLKRSERIKDVQGYEGLYAVTTLGRVWSYRKKRWIKSWVDEKGYMRVLFCVKTKITELRLHRLVGQAFIKNPQSKPQINHINGIKADCKVTNLEWVTARENLQHASDMGLNKTYKLSYHDKEIICQFRDTFELSLSELAEIFEVSPPAIHYIVKTYTPITVIS